MFGPVCTINIEEKCPNIQSIFLRKQFVSGFGSLHRKGCCMFEPETIVNIEEKCSNIQSTFRCNNSKVTFFVYLFSDSTVITMVSGDEGGSRKVSILKCMYNLPVFYRADLVLHTN